MASYSSAIPYIKKSEGGLSRAVTDTASSNPSPYTYQGKSGWHTNRGITWTTFKSLAPSAGYTVSESNFLNMPDDIWLKIYKTGYWNPMKGDTYTSQPVANAVVDFAWAAGVGGSTKALIKYLSKQGMNADGPISIANSFNNLVKRHGEAKVFNDLIDERKRFFVSLNQPANEKGWLSRMEELRTQGSALVVSGGKFVKKHWLATTLIVVGLSGIMVGLVLGSKK